VVGVGVWLDFGCFDLWGVCFLCGLGRGGVGMGGCGVFGAGSLSRYLVRWKTYKGGSRCVSLCCERFCWVVLCVKRFAGGFVLSVRSWCLGVGG